MLLVSKRGKKRERKVSKSFSFFSLVCFNEESNVVALVVEKKAHDELPKKKKIESKTRVKKSTTEKERTDEKL